MIFNKDDLFSIKADINKGPAIIKQPKKFKKPKYSH